MKTLLLMRHAKSSWKDKDLPDQERPLNKRGKKDAPIMGHWLKEQKDVPQRILSSSAQRARQTAESVVEASGYKGEVDYLDRLYMAEVDEYLNTLKELPDNLDRIMIIGHNPGLETLLQILSGKIESLPTAVVANLSLPIDHWADLSAETPGELVEIWRPREVRKEEESSKSKEKGKKKKSK